MDPLQCPCGGEEFAIMRPGAVCQAIKWCDCARIRGSKGIVTSAAQCTERREAQSMREKRDRDRQAPCSCPWYTFAATRPQLSDNSSDGRPHSWAPVPSARRPAVQPTVNYPSVIGLDVITHRGGRRGHGTATLRLRRCRLPRSLLRRGYGGADAGGADLATAPTRFADGATELTGATIPSAADAAASGTDEWADGPGSFQSS